MTLSFAEKKAEEATKLSAFPVNFHKVRSHVETVLNEWKTSGFFQEYTDHSFVHVRDMLETVEWLIPPETQSEMTSADWFMLVLAIYFHDMGLIITRAEFDGRYKDPDFKTFLDNPVLSAEKHAQFQAKLGSIPTDVAERLRYEEYVRFSHGKRVRSWLEGGFAFEDTLSPMRHVLEELVRPLDPTIRRDLALLCESHTLNGIENTTIYKTSQPYGGEDETVNLQYCAAILRTVDLIQITRKRAPGVLYQLINPSDPQSQIEWQKQTAVRTVRAALGRDREGNVSKDALSDTIEVHATFTEPNGFFGLTSYLAYAAREISQTHNAIQKSEKNVVRKYLFPWRFINSDSIETQGFLTDSFEFELDQHKILDLLTGHTLYNDTSVVLRELTQNALDAVRLQAEIDGVKSEDVGHVTIEWDSTKRSLTISDNGTGMTQEVIEGHLLKVGSSRYQDAKFKEKHPNFHSISRFGIGVLSAFMVSDDVQITTCSEEEEKARRIALRSVHGKYLIKLLDKVTDRKQLPMYPHGTSVQMIIRPTATIGDILLIARSWLMFPRCKVTVIKDGDAGIDIGYASPKEAISAHLATYPTSASRFRREYDVKEYSENGVTLAFAVVKDDLFQDWNFVDAPRGRPHYDEDEEEEGLLPIGTCVEGVTVEADTPGYKGRTFLAVANAVGPTAPKTNVARSSLEDTVEQREMLKIIYSLYARHVTEEIGRLASSGTHSLSRAVGVAPWLTGPLLQGDVSKPGLLSDAMAEVPLVLVETSTSRNNVSFSALSKTSDFWTIESPLYKSVEYFVKEAPAEVTAQKILSTLGNQVTSGSNGLVLCNLRSRYVDENVKQRFEIVEVAASRERRQIELKWSKKDLTPSWMSSIEIYQALGHKDPKFWRYLHDARERFRQRQSYQFNSDSLSVPLSPFVHSGLDNASSFMVNRERYLQWGTPLVAHFLELQSLPDADRLRSITAVFIALETFKNWEIASSESLERSLSYYNLESVQPYLGDIEKLADAIQRTGDETFDPFAWERRMPQEQFEM
jgi:molecular chaperone HtpG